MICRHMKSTINYEVSAAPLEESTISAMWDLAQICFTSGPSPAFSDRVAEKRNPMAVMAWRDQDPVGFKLGYERTHEEFYSWLGGVHPDFRRCGIANELLVLQHDWCRRNGYRSVSTEALNHNRAMLKLNLQHGFLIVGTRTDDRGLKVLLARDLAEALV